MYKCVIFDVDGTLIDTEVAVKKSLQKVLYEECQKEYSLDTLDFALGIPGRDTLEKLGIKDIDRAHDNWNKYMSEYKDSVKVFNGIENSLEELKANNIQLGIVTSKTEEELNADFVEFGLMKYLDYIVCADHTEKHKPDPEPILKFLELSGFSDKEVIYIGDTIYDYKAAKGASVKFALALWGAKNPESVGADIKIAEPKDIIKDLNFLF
jgi:HAD superfamily hydrolase (TIGR01549 family)